MKLETFGQNVNTRLKNEYGIDPLTIIMILSILVQIGKMLSQCGYSSLEETIRKRPIFSRLWIKKHLGEFLDSDYYNKYGSCLSESILSEVSKLSQNEIAELISSN